MKHTKLERRFSVPWGWRIGHLGLDEYFAEHGQFALWPDFDPNFLVSFLLQIQVAVAFLPLCAPSNSKWKNWHYGSTCVSVFQTPITNPSSFSYTSSKIHFPMNSIAANPTPWARTWTWFSRTWWMFGWSIDRSYLISSSAWEFSLQSPWLELWMLWLWSVAGVENMTEAACLSFSCNSLSNFSTVANLKHHYHTSP